MFTVTQKLKYVFFVTVYFINKTRMHFIYLFIYFYRFSQFPLVNFDTVLAALCPLWSMFYENFGPASHEKQRAAW